MTAEDGEELKDVVRQVHKFATQERFRYKHYYRTGEFFAWDNVSARLTLLRTPLLRVACCPRSLCLCPLALCVPPES